ncbi:hypothetical protein Tco_0932167 [Tanacetum coccineum]
MSGRMLECLKDMPCGSDCRSLSDENQAHCIRDLDDRDCVLSLVCTRRDECRELNRDSTSRMSVEKDECMKAGNDVSCVKALYGDVRSNAHSRVAEHTTIGLTCYAERSFDRRCMALAVSDRVACKGSVGSRRFALSMKRELTVFQGDKLWYGNERRESLAQPQGEEEIQPGNSYLCGAHSV